MLEVDIKKNGEYENKTIKLVDLGKGQSVEFTIDNVYEGASRFPLTDKDKNPIKDEEGNEIKALYYRVSGVYHKSTGDVENVTMWFNQSIKDKDPVHVQQMKSNIGKRVKITKDKKEGAKHFYYRVEEAKLELNNKEKDCLEMLKKNNIVDVADYIANFQTNCQTSEARAREIFEKRDKL